jgi:hypothetical protein
MEVIKKIIEGDYEIRIIQDDCPDDPSTWDNLGKLCLSHRRYNLANNSNISFSAYDGWEEIKDAIYKDGAEIVLTVRGYDHSGFTISTSSSGQFSDHWDSGQVGFIYTTKKDILKFYGKKRVSAELIKKAKERLVYEVELYDKYLTGEVYTYSIIKKSTCKECQHIHEECIDSCGGYYEDQEAIDAAKELIQSYKK